MEIQCKCCGKTFAVTPKEVAGMMARQGVKARARVGWKHLTSDNARRAAKARWDRVRVAAGQPTSAAT
jgi:hypothetical protein